MFQSTFSPLSLSLLVNVFTQCFANILSPLSPTHSSSSCHLILIEHNFKVFHQVNTPTGRRVSSSYCQISLYHEELISLNNCHLRGKKKYFTFSFFKWKRHRLCGEIVYTKMRFSLTGYFPDFYRLTYALRVHRKKELYLHVGATHAQSRGLPTKDGSCPKVLKIKKKIRLLKIVSDIQGQVESSVW